MSPDEERAFLTAFLACLKYGDLRGRWVEHSIEVWSKTRHGYRVNVTCREGKGGVPMLWLDDVIPLGFACDAADTAGLLASLFTLWESAGEEAAG
ncbi:hypothetical protein [Rhizohabitans arisaemae]|uniref:hypothetical protein n=1 Tax=Rhizohabitans arisaemae TaxID=2720610 RepID=UPI0024B167DB|nr:hypothetical protein [Rhizohabitans arisaemae]